jgi:hypothetical protein
MARIPPALAPWLEALLSPWALLSLTAVSVALCAASLIGVTWVVSRMPTDYLMGNAPRPPARGWRLIGRVLRNLLGAVLLLLGLLLLALPGQGLLTICVGLMLVDFPGKRRLERRLLAARGVLSTINALRRRRGRPELRWTAGTPGDGADEPTRRDQR